MEPIGYRFPLRTGAGRARGLIMTDAHDPVKHFAECRNELIGLGYRMTGSLATAEDIAQDVFLRWHATDRLKVDAPRSWLLKTAMRLSLDHLKSAQHRREHYVGPWLPEPLLVESVLPQEASCERAQDLSVAFLLTLQRLTPAERAVFILHDLFETPFAELANLLGRTEMACRKLATRARAHLTTDTPRQVSTDIKLEEISHAFLTASRDGDESALRGLLAEDVVLHTDGGGLRPAARNLISGTEKVSRFFAGLARKRTAASPLLHVGHINTLPGFVTLEADGLLQTTSLEIRNDRITVIYIVRNPDKLHGVQYQIDAFRNKHKKAGLSVIS